MSEMLINSVMLVMPVLLVFASIVGKEGNVSISGDVNNVSHVGNAGVVVI